jgi:ribosome maturation factor RimP
MLSISKIDELIQPVLKQNAIGKYHIEFIKGSTPILEISIEKEDGSMDLDTCELVSGQISKILDMNDDKDDSHYMLDVCSFGAEKQLYSAEEVKQNIGEYVHVELREPKNGLDQVEGYLRSFENDLLEIDYLLKGVKKHATINYDNVKLIRLAVKF